MGSVVDAAQALAEEIAEVDPDHHVSVDVRDVATPGWLVVPLPTWEFDVLEAGVVTLTWEIYAVGPNPGDLETAATLGAMVAALLTSELDVDRAEPARYRLPGHTDPLPAYRMTRTDTVEIST